MACRKKAIKLLSRLIVYGAIIFSLSSIFPAGMINSSSQKNICSSYFTALTSNHTKGKTYSAMIVEPKNEKTKGLNNTALEFYKLYGTFRQDRACFANTYNINRDVDIKLNDTDINNLSLLFTSSGLNLDYHEGIGWRHEFYPLDMMYGAPKSERPPFQQYCFISKTQADALLKAGITGEPINPPYSESDYKKIQYSIIYLNCCGESVPYCVLSIFYETNYYFDALNEIMGDFVFVYGKTPNNLKKQATFFMRDYNFQNEYYIDYASEQYDINDFDYKVGKYNVIDGFGEKEDISSLIFPNINNTFSNVIVILAVIFLLFSLVLIVVFDFAKSWLDLIPVAFSLFTPYLTFKLFALISESVRFFTPFSTQLNMLFVLVYIIIFAIIIVFKKFGNKEEPYEENDSNA